MKRLLKWMLANQFQHAQSFLAPSLRHRSVPKGLRERIEGRLRAGKRLLAVRALLVVILFLGVGFVTTFLTGLVDGPARLAVQLLSILIPVVAAPAILILSRTIRLIETDVYILASEVVARCKQAGGPLPSEFHVRLRKPKK